MSQSATSQTNGGPRRGELPILDLGPFLAGDPAAAEPAAATLRDAYETLGFMCVVNHGVPSSLVDRMEDKTRRFHALPMEEKLRYRVTEDQRGYIPPRATRIAHSTYNRNTRSDSNETLVVATEYPPDHPGVEAGRRFFGPNPWPADPPELKATALEYMATMTALGKRMLPLWALALELPPDFFDPYFEEPYVYLRLAHYPPQPDLLDNDFGIGPHADTGFQTFLPPAKEEGLEILGVDGGWFRPQVPSEGLVVNAGQFLERWSNERIRATPHRVIPPTENDRYSVPCFVNTSFDMTAAPLPTCVSEDNPAKYPTQSYWEFFQWYMTNAYPHYGVVAASEEA